MRALSGLSVRIDPIAHTNDARAGYDWWSLQPIVRPEPPTVKDASWPINDIDQFILARLESRGIRPAEPADARTLIRRVHFGLIGLPPERIRNQEFGILVDLLLDSPHFGERWARHWLDVVRFGESQGFERNWLRPFAWRYRDWVISAFNSDMPYDKFIRQQVAGDVLDPHDPTGLIATSYLTCGPWDMASARNGSEIMKRMSREAELEEQLATLGQAFLGLTLHCARCHDHKFDPISTKDYYSVAAAIGGVWRGHREIISTQDSVGVERQALEVRIQAIRAEMAEIDAGEREQVQQAAVDEAHEVVAQLTKKFEKEQVKRDKARARLATATDEEERLKITGKITSAERLILRARLSLDGAEDLVARLTRRLPALNYGEILNRLPEEQRAPYRQLVLRASQLEMRHDMLTSRMAHGVVPREPGVFHVLARGDFRQPQQPVSARGIAAVRGLSSDFGLAADAPEAERRRQLARWISDRRNPLTAESLSTVCGTITLAGDSWKRPMTSVSTVVVLHIQRCSIGWPTS